MSDKAPSSIAFRVMLLIHCVAGFVLFAVLVGFVPKYAALFERLGKRGELPAVTVFALALSKYWYCVLLFGFALDVAVLFALDRLPPRFGWLTVLWFCSVLAAIVLLVIITFISLLLPVLKMGSTI